MFRRYGIASVLLLLLSFSLWGQVTTSGEFVAEMNILPSVELKKASLSLSVSYASWVFTSVSEFGPAGFTNQQFSLSGSLGPFQISGGMAFNPTDDRTITVNFPEHCDPQSASVTLEPPAYKWSWLELSFTFAGFSLAGRMEHWAYPYIPEWADEFETYTWPCCAPEQTPSAYMFFLLSAKAAPFFLDMRFADCCTGITFSDLTLGFGDLSLCCGVTLDFYFYFTKAGFQYALFELENIPFICCGFALDFAIKFTAESKEVSIKPKWVGVGNICIQVYGDVHMEGASITGIEVYGYKIRCELAPCHSLEFMTVFSPDVVDEVEKNCWRRLRRRGSGIRALWFLWSRMLRKLVYHGRRYFLYWHPGFFVWFLPG